MNANEERIWKPYTFKSGMEVRNRLFMAPMTNYSSNPDGSIHEDEITYYRRRSQGVGAVVTAVAHVTPGGQGFDGQVGVDRDALIPGLSRVAEAIKSGGAKAILQIFHAGRLSRPHLVPDGDITAPSNIPAESRGMPGPTPRELTTVEIEEIIEAFGKATVRAIKAGFDGVEIHGANGYLIQQFFSPHANRRNDKYGGTLEKRMTFSLAVIDSVQKAVSEHADEPFIVGYRFSPEEPDTPGITMAETLPFIDVLAEKDLDYLHVSLGEFWSKARRGADSDRTRIDLLLEQINNRVPLVSVGSIRTSEDAFKAMQSGVDFLALGRALVIDPEWVEKTKEGKYSEIETVLDLHAKDRLDIPERFWKVILSVPGWFPGVN